MAQPDLPTASPNAHLLTGQMPAPHQFRASIWEGTGLSIAAHAILFGILAYAATHVSQVVQTANDVTGRLEVVLLARRGPGAQGRDGGHAAADPSTHTQATRTTPVQMTRAADPTNVPDVIPTVTVQANQMLPGVAVQLDPRSPAQGAGRESGNGRGPATGPGDGQGTGQDRSVGFGDVHGVGTGITSPVLIREIKPNYTVRAMAAKLQGAVEMEAVVLPDGSIDPASIRITRSLDAIFGLDEQAIAAVRQWRFRPGTLKGQPVAVRVSVELTFTLR